MPDEVLAADLDEQAGRGETARQTSLRLARAKADAVSGLRPDSHVLAADTIVSLANGNRQLGKPGSRDQARAMLGLLSGRRHRVVTSVVLRAPDGRRGERTAESVVAFSRLTERQIDWLLEDEAWADKAGGYAIQERAAAMVRHLSGSHSNVVGLPLFETAQLLRSQALLV